MFGNKSSSKTRVLGRSNTFSHLDRMGNNHSNGSLRRSIRGSPFSAQPGSPSFAPEFNPAFREYASSSHLDRVRFSHEDEGTCSDASTDSTVSRTVSFADSVSVQYLSDDPLCVDCEDEQHNNNDPASRSYSLGYIVEEVTARHQVTNNIGRKTGARGVDDDRRSHSSTDVRGEGSVDGSSESPPLSRRKRLWNSFKKRTNKLRSRSREKPPAKKLLEDGRLASSQPDLPNSDHSPSHSPVANQAFDTLFDAAHRRHQGGDSDNQEELQARLSNGSALRNGTEGDGEVDSGIAVGDQQSGSEVSSVRQRHAALRAHPFFQMDVVLKEGRDLVVRDSCGTSDPYVKFKIGGKQFYKSRIVYKNLNPKWDEKFSLPIEDAFKPIQVKVYDYDRGLNDDPMGGSEIDVSTMELNVQQEVKLTLSEKASSKKPENMGYLILQCTLVPKTQDEKEQYFKRMTKLGDQAKKLKTQIWSSVVTIVLIEGKELLPMDDNGFSDPYVKFRLGNERYKSKYKAKTLRPKWLEQFDLHMFDDQTSHLEISVWDHDVGGKDDIMGRCVIDLSAMEREKTLTLEQPLEDGAGIVHMLLSISGTSGNETISDLSCYHPNPKDRQDIVRKYGLLNSLKNMNHLGWLSVKVVKAQGLAAADLGGKSDPFCVLELVNARLQTQTEYKTLCPEWGKIFTFNVKDVHSIMEITVYDEDRDKKAEFLGKVAIPILRIRPGERRWYQLKDRKGVQRSKGAIQLEMDYEFNHVKAAIRTFNPREEKYMQPEPKFKLSVMKRNIDRVSKIAKSGVEAGNFIQSCFDWDSKPRSITAFAVYLIIVWNFELYMLPVTILIVFLKNLLVHHIVGNLMKERDEDDYVDEEDDVEDEDVDAKGDKKSKESKEEKQGFREKLQAIQDVCLQVQEGMDMAASMGERVKNTFNWTVPWLSWLAVTLMTVGTIVLFYVPLRFLIMAFGINKFTKKLRAPNAIPNNELADYLSRVPSDKELMMYRELRPDPNVGTMKKKRS